MSCLIGPEHVDVLAPLYEHLHEHHAKVAPRLGHLPARTVAESWARRRRRYLTWLERPGFAMLATEKGELVGYLLASVEGAYQGWHSGERVGDVHDISVLPAARNRGIGSALLNAAEAQLALHGIAEYRLSVIAPNTGALRLYRQRGLTPVSHVLLGRTGLPR
jgi:ribosomal protein S18 acetylase RimI-like enzyme